MKGFIVKQPWADLILSGKKTWEIRSSRTHIRGVVGVVSEGKWIGTVEIIDSLSISSSEFSKRTDKHCVPKDVPLNYKNIHAWVLTNPIRFEYPKKYHHKLGCVIWVSL